MEGKHLKPQKDRRFKRLEAEGDEEEGGTGPDVCWSFHVENPHLAVQLWVEKKTSFCKHILT